MESLQQAIRAARAVAYKPASKHLKPAASSQSDRREEYKGLLERLLRLEEKFELIIDRLPAPTRDEVDQVAVNQEQVKAPVTIRLIKQTVANKYGVAVVDLESQRRAKRICYPRQLVMFLAYKLTTMSYPEIGRRLGHRDHTTAMAGVRRIKALLEGADAPTVSAVDELLVLIPELATHENPALSEAQA